jgi:hypothetical protein
MQLGRHLSLLCTQNPKLFRVLGAKRTWVGLSRRCTRLPRCGVRGQLPRMRRLHKAWLTMRCIIRNCLVIIFLLSTVLVVLTGDIASRWRTRAAYLLQNTPGGREHDRRWPCGLGFRVLEFRVRRWMQHSNERLNGLPRLQHSNERLNGSPRRCAAQLTVGRLSDKWPRGAAQTGAPALRISLFGYYTHEEGVAGGS